MHTPAKIIAMTLLLSSAAPCSAKEGIKTQASSPAQAAQSQPSGEARSKTTDPKQKDSHRLERMMDQRDWDHRKAGRDWRLRGEHENLGH